MKKSTKKTAKKQEEGKCISECVKGEISEGIYKIKNNLNIIKTKYDNADEATKKNITSGVLGTLVVIAGIIGISKVRRKIKQRNKRGE
jgi:hypothetical protein